MCVTAVQAAGVRAFWLDWQRGAALEAAQSVGATWFIWFGICFVFGAEESAIFSSSSISVKAVFYKPGFWPAGFWGD